MLKTVDNILEQRLHRAGSKPGGVASWVYSILCHAGIAAGLWFVPELLAKPPAEFEYVPMMVVSPAVLGIEEPTPVVPRTPEPEPEPEPPPPEPEPEPEPADEDAMVLQREEEKKPEARKPPAAAPPPPVPAPVTPPPKRQGSPFGNPLGAQTSKARLGAEDPNFTYGYYLDRVVATISGNWVRPPVGADVEQAVLYFRIQRDGTVTDLRIATPSGSEQFDVAAFRAVESSSPLPPLPKGYQRDYLGINLIVR